MTSPAVHAIATRIRQELGQHVMQDAKFDVLFDMYAVLAITKGVAVTNQDVHIVWSIWARKHQPDHPAIAPYETLSRETQEADTPYTNAIRAVATSMDYHRP